MSDPARLGFSGRVQELFAPLAEQGFSPARVIRVDRGMPLVAGPMGVVRAEPATHLVKSAADVASRVAVGDWVALGRPEGHDLPIIEVILPRAGMFSRKDPGSETGQQVVIANVDVVFVVQSLSGDGVNDRRLERELVLAWESGARPVVVLTKADLVEDADEVARFVSEIAIGVEVIVESAVTGIGIDAVRAAVPLGTTAALLGGSGVGKSTLVNRLVGHEVLLTNETRSGDDKGRHTTVAREMVLVPDGGVIIDTPGMRGLALWDAEEGLSAAFPDMEELAVECRFRDCTHVSEPGCAVVAAVETGELSPRRLESWRRLRTELDSLAARQDEHSRREQERKFYKPIAKFARQHRKDIPRDKGR
ncbi:MAG: ribosome small subunit-dependent GTPase A [Actinomycetota bacterium]|nr:ribosome small subunit-dependent GTPase A [Actinomycetota bacterium]